MAYKHKHFLTGLVCVILAVSLAFYDFISSPNSSSTKLAELKTESQKKYKVREPQISCTSFEDETLPKTFRLKIDSGDTLASLIQRQGVHHSEIHKLIRPMKSFYKPRELRSDHIIDVTIAKENSNSPYFEVQELKIRPAFEYEIIVNRTKEGTYEAKKRSIKLVEEVKWTEGIIYGSLYDAAYQQGAPGKAIHDMYMVFSHDVDFQRQLQQGDQFGMLYSVFTDPETGKQRPGKLLFASLTLNGKIHELYNFKTNCGTEGFYNPNGESVRKGLLRTPIDGARLSSRFGARLHPILGYTKQHKGVDFSAPTGTPIMAAGDGIVEQVGRWGHYGNYVRIRHNREYSTAYAHLSRYAKGLRRGQRIYQGQLLGYVGSTGRTTGAHLHYEVLKNNRHINPLSVKMMPSAKLNHADLKAFKITIEKIKDKKFYLKEHFAAMQTAMKTKKLSTHTKG